MIKGVMDKRIGYVMLIGDVRDAWSSAPLLMSCNYYSIICMYDTLYCTHTHAYMYMYTHTHTNSHR